MSDEKNKTVDAGAAQAEEPKTLEEAVKLAFAAGQADDPGAVAGEDKPGDDGAEADVKGEKPAADPGPAAADGGGDVQKTEQGSAGADDPADGGSPAAAAQTGQADTGAERQVTDEDVTSAVKSLGDEIMGRARQAALKEFQENGIEPWTIDKLYSKDENSGRVEFKNPDDPQHPFASRAEAQSWVDAMNSQIKSAFQQRIEAHGREFAKEEKPKVELIRFLPKYQKLDKVTREVFDGVVDQFKIVKDGNVVGFGCDLDAALKQTEAVIGNLTKITRSQAQTQTETPPAAEAPALDMKSGGGSGVSKEPATLAEALKMTYEQDAEKGKKK